MRLNERICRARKEKGFTQEELAGLAGVTVRTIQRIEGGENVPRAYTLKAVAKVLDLSYETLTAVEAEQETVSAKERPGEVIHFLKIFNLSCFSFLMIPWVHFLVPAFLLRKQNDIGERAIAAGRKIIRQQMYWTVAFHGLMLFTFAYNYFQVTIFGNMQYVINYLWPVFIMYVLNAGVIVYNNMHIRSRFKAADYQ